MSPLDFLAEPVFLRLGSTLAHFVWQGFAAAALVWLALRCVSRGRPVVRYRVALAGLLFVAACPVVTFAVLWQKESLGLTGQVEVLTGEMDAQWSSQYHWPDDVGDADRIAERVAIARQGKALWLGISTLHDISRSLANLWVAVRPYSVLQWLCGVLLLSARLLLGWVGVHWLTRGSRPVPAEYQHRFHRLARRLGHSHARIVDSPRVSEALAIGFWRPLVLLPAAWLVELSPGVLEAIVAHELAHLRRHDLWINLAQRCIETLLFYHPAVWWLSKRIRVERELCCDELAVDATGRRVEYASALELVARKRLASPRLLLAAPIGGESKMNLLYRVRHVLGLAPAPEPTRLWPVGLIMLAAPLALWAAGSGLFSTMPRLAVADDERAEKKEGDVDVRDREDRLDDEERRDEARKDDVRKREVRKDEERREIKRKELDREREERKSELRDNVRATERKKVDGEEVKRAEKREAAEREGGSREDALMKMIAQLRDEVAQLRKEVRELRSPAPVPAREAAEELIRQAREQAVQAERKAREAAEAAELKAREALKRRAAEHLRELPRKGSEGGEDGKELDRPRGKDRKEEERKEGDPPRDEERRERELPQVNGVIRGVEGKLVEITLGSHDGVKPGQLLGLIRGDKYLGRLVVVKVAPDRAVGEVKTLVGDDVRLQSGDQVIPHVEAPHRDELNKN